MSYIDATTAFGAQSGIVALEFNEIDAVGGSGEVQNVAAAALTGASAARVVAGLAGAASGGTGAAVVLLAGAALGVAAYYLTD
jgi:hypothetical protein